MNHQALIQALPEHAAKVVCVGLRLDAIRDDIERIAGDASITCIDLDGDAPPERLPFEDGSIHAMVLHGALRKLDAPTLQGLLGEAHRILGDGGRLVVRDTLPPYDRLSPRLGRALLRAFGVRYTSNEVFAMMELAGFWDCLVLRSSSVSRDVVVKGDKVVQRASLGPRTDDAEGDGPTISLVK